MTQWQNCQISNIAGVKDATGDAARPTRLLNQIGERFAQLSGEDATCLPYLAAGGHGCISVVSNIAPALCAQMHEAFAKGDIARAQKLTARLCLFMMACLLRQALVL